MGILSREHANIAPEDIHHHAEKLEHAHELADEVDRTLGHPRHDPHGSEIPGGRLKLNHSEWDPIAGA